MGKSRGRHAAPRSGFSRFAGWVAGGAGLLLIAGILVSVAAPGSSSGSAPDPTPTVSASLFDLKGFAAGPAKPNPAPQVTVPKTVLDPDAVADPYGAPAAPAAPVAPVATATPDPGAGG